MATQIMWSAKNSKITASSCQMELARTAASASVWTSSLAAGGQRHLRAKSDVKQPIEIVHESDGGVMQAVEIPCIAAFARLADQPSPEQCKLRAGTRRCADAFGVVCPAFACCRRHMKFPRPAS